MLSNSDIKLEKVLHLIGGGDVGGAKTHVLSLVNVLSRQIGVKIVSLRPGMFADEAKALGIDIEIVKSGNIIKDIRRVVRIAREGYQIIHSHGAKANMIAIAVKAITRLPTVTTVHSDYKLDYMHSFVKRLSFGTINTIALRFIDNYIGISNNFVDMLIRRKFLPDRIFTLYHGMDFDAPTAQYSREQFLDKFKIPVRPGEIIVGIAARLYPVKGLDTLLRAAARVKDNTTAVKFIIGGDGVDRELLENMSRRLGLADTVFFTGWLTDPYSLMSIVDISVLTSISESFPYSILEGARFAKPTVSTRVGGIPDLIRDNVDGLLFEPNDYSRLADFIIRLAGDAGLRERLGHSIYERAMDKFSIQTMRASQTEIYRSVLRNAERKKNDYDIIISGYYGFDNIGDDAMLKGIVENLRLKRPGARLAILSKAPVRTALTYRVNTFNRLNILDATRVMRPARLFIHGGGNIVQDSTSTRSLFFYLTITMLAKIMHTKVMFFGNGFGPLIKPFNRRVSGRVLNHADVITVREKLSLGELESLSVDKPIIRLTADPALLVSQVAPAETIDAILDNEGIPPGRQYVGFSVREYLGETMPSAKRLYGARKPPTVGARKPSTDGSCKPLTVGARKPPIDSSQNAQMGKASPPEFEIPETGADTPETGVDTPETGAETLETGADTPEIGSEYLLAIAKAADIFCSQNNLIPVFLPTEYPRDVRQSEKVLALMKTRGYIIRRRNSVAETFGIVARMEMMVAMRLHALIFAANLGVPVVSIEYQPKIEGFIKYIGQPSAGRMENLEYESLLAQMERVWGERAEIRLQLKSTMDELRKKAFDNVNIAVELLDGAEKRRQKRG